MLGDPECALAAQEQSEREVDADEEGVGASRPIAVGAIENHLSVFIADVAAADEVQGGESIDTEGLVILLYGLPSRTGA